MQSKMQHFSTQPNYIISQITSELRDSVDLVINAQNIKRHITRIMQKPDG